MEATKIIVINGIKMEVDTRSATVRKVEGYRVGDPVKLLRKDYSGYAVKPGVIAGFEDFKNRPTIVIAYLDYSELKFESIYEGSEHEIISAGEADLDLNKDYIADKMAREIEKKEQEVKDLVAKREFFLKTFACLAPKAEASA